MSSGAGRWRESPGIVVAAIASGAGHVVHNLAEFPPAVLLGPETLGPLGVTAVLAWAMLYRPSRVTFLAAAGWALVVIVGGGATVYPFAFLPFSPEQTVSHYAVHLLYAVAQLPLLWVAGRRSLAAQ